MAGIVRALLGVGNNEMASGSNVTDVSNSQNGDISASAASASAASSTKGANTSATKFDCYPYTFSPLLLFAEANYFDKG